MLAVLVVVLTTALYVTGVRAAASEAAKVPAFIAALARTHTLTKEALRVACTANERACT